MFTFDQSLQDCPFPSLYQPEVILIIILIHATYLIVLDLTPLILFCEEYNNTALSPSLLSSQANKSMFLKHNMGFKMRLSSQDESCIHILRTDTTEKQCSSVFIELFTSIQCEWGLQQLLLAIIWVYSIYGTVQILWDLRGHMRWLEKHKNMYWEIFLSSVTNFPL